MKNWISPFIIAIGLVITGSILAVGLVNIKNDNRVVSVKGLCEIEKPANHVIWPIGYNEVGNDLVAIYNNLEGKNKIIIAFLTKNGISGEEISLGAPSIVDRNANQYNTSEYVGARYVATQIITVSSKQVDKVRELMVEQAELLKSNIAIATSWQYETRYSFTELDSVKPSMIEQATKNARLTAEKFAQDSQSSLGKIVSASQGQLTIEDRDANTPYIKILRVVTSIQYQLED